jgi:uncharacterized membrane-anchored protein YitT (DUF2179 family)
MKANWWTKQTLLDFLLITVGTLVSAVGIYFFKFPNHFSTGGVSGLSIILNGLFPAVKASYFVTGINIVLLAIGLIFIGKGFGIRTIYASLLLSFSLQALETFVPLQGSVTGEPMLDLCFSVLLPAAGSAVLFNVSASTGGTDIVAMILKKYTSLHIGTALFCVDFLIAASSGVVFGLPIALFSLLGLLAKALVVDNVIESINLSKYFFIVTKTPDEICDYVQNQLHRSATIWYATGAYTHDSRSVVLTVLKRGQAVALQHYVRKCDPHAFVIISNTSEIIGKGFRSTQV